MAIQVNRYIAQAGGQGSPPASPFVPAGGNEFQGLAQTGNALAAFAEKRAAAQRELDLLKATSGAQKELADLEFEIGRDPNYRQAEQTYGAKAKEIVDKYGANITDPLVKGAFDARVSGYVATQALNVRKDAWKRETDDAKGTLDEVTAQAVRGAAASRTDIEEKQHIDGAVQAINSMEAGGYLTRQEAVNKIQALRKDVEGYRVLRVVNSQFPEDALQTLLDPKQLPWLDPKTRETYIGRVQNQIEIKQRQEIAAAERAEREADRNLKRGQTSTEAGLIGRIVAGEPISEGQLAELARRQQISDDGWRMLRSELRGRGEGVDNPNVVADLTSRMVRGGEDIFADLMRERQNGNISRGTLDGLVKENQARIDRGQKEQFKTAGEREGFDFVQNYITGGKGMFELSDETKQRFALASREYLSRLRADPNAVPDDIARDVVAKYAATIKVMPQSGYYQAPTDRPSLDAAKARLKALFDGQLITPEVAARESAKLKAFEDSLPPAPPPAKPGSKPGTVQKKEGR